MLYTIGLIGDGKYVSDFLWGLITSSHWSLISGIYVSGRSVSQWHWSQCPLEITVEQQIDVKTLENNELMQDFSSLPSLTVHILISWAFDSAEIGTLHPTVKNWLEASQDEGVLYREPQILYADAKPISSPSHDCLTQCGYPNLWNQSKNTNLKSFFSPLFLCGDFPCFSSTNKLRFWESLTFPLDRTVFSAQPPTAVLYF